MSARLFSDDVLFEQRLLACGGYYKGKLDGVYGPMTLAAEAAAAAGYHSLRTGYFVLDTRSEKNIATLLPDMQAKARGIMTVAAHLQKTTGISCVILSGTRTYAEQNALFAKRPKVTNARGGQSNHNFGIAIDVGLFKDGRYMTGAAKGDDAAYRQLAAEVKKNVSNIEWGGDWKSFKDLPHYQLATGLTLAQVRAQFEKGKLTQ